MQYSAVFGLSFTKRVSFSLDVYVCVFLIFPSLQLCIFDVQKSANAHTAPRKCIGQTEEQTKENEKKIGLNFWRGKKWWMWKKKVANE